MQDMHNSQKGISTLRCGHIMHANCLDEFMSKHIACPICKKSVVDPKDFEEYFDEEMANSPMPEEYRNLKM